MKWKSAEFKGNKVWVAVDDQENLISNDGLTPIRYSKSEDSKIYSGRSEIISIDTEAAETMAGGKKTATNKAKKQSSGFGSSGERTEAQRNAAEKDARTFLDALSGETIKCFTDGACHKNPGPCGTGVYMVIGEREIEHSRYLGEGTNNIAEISAVIDALDILIQEKIEKSAAIVLCTDSKYVEGLLTKNWKAKANQALVADMRQKFKSFSNIQIRWVAGHANIDENERADQLATAVVEANK